MEGKKRHRVRNILLTVTGIILGLVVLTILFISPITKWAVEKYDVEYLGREVTMDWAYVNPFTGHVYFNDFKIYESDQDEALTDSVFFSTSGLGLDLSVRKLFSKEYEIKSLTLDKPKTTIIQYKRKNEFNFTDIMEKFSKQDTTADTLNKPPVHFSLLDVKIKEGEIHYRESQIPVNYFIKEFNFESEGMRWDVDTVAGKFDFVAGIGSGKVEGSFTYNLKNKKYGLSTGIHHMDMTIIQQYMRDFSRYGTVRAILNATFDASGKLNDAKAVDGSGRIELSDFHFGKNPKEDYAAFDKLLVDIIRVNPKVHQEFDTIMLTHPAFKFEKYDHLDNIQNIFGKGGDKVKQANSDPEHFNLIIELAKYIRKLVEDFFQSEFRINHFEINNADLKYVDYTQSEKFVIGTDALSVIADSVYKERKRAHLSLRSGINPYGTLSADLAANTKDSSDFDFVCTLQKVPLTVFNPYLVTHTSYPLDRGTLDFNAKWHVRHGNITSENHLVLVDPRLSHKVKRNDNNWAPMPLVMAFVRERGNVIDYEIPIGGNLKNPKFHISDVLLDLLKNIFIKPPTLPYGLKVAQTEQKIEKSLTFKWEIRECVLREDQRRFLNKVSDFMKKNTNAKITVIPVEYAIKEKEHILLFETKKKFFLDRNHKKARDFSSDDSTAVARLSIKDSSFVKYLNQHAGKELLFTVQEKCERITPPAKVNEVYKALNKKREENFMAVFRENGTADRIKINHERNTIPYNGYSFFKIDYQGDMPEELKKAYRELEEMDEEYPRKKYFWERKKLRDIFNASK